MTEIHKSSGNVFDDIGVERPGKELKDHRVPIMMSDEEIHAVDDWRFANRIATRSEAIRRLCKIALAHEAKGNANA